MKNRRIWPVLLVLVGAVLLAALIIHMGTGNNSQVDEHRSNTTYKKSYSNSTKTKSSDLCIEPYCQAKKMDGGEYCSSHTCNYPGCRNRQMDGKMYCAIHKDTKNAPKNDQPKSEKTDFYNASDYDDPDDFYEDYYYDFEDYDEAEQYWDENH